MKKLLPLFLLLTVLFLVSCDTRTPAAAVPDVTIDLTEYTLVRPERASGRLIRAAAALKQTIDEHCGIQTTIIEDWIKRDGSEDDRPLEICIGQVNRTALADITFGNLFVKEIVDA